MARRRRRRSMRPAWWELCLYDVQGAAVLGGDVSLLASGRLDNQVSCWAATTSLAASPARRRGVDDRPERPRGGRVGEHDRCQRTAPRARPRAARHRTRRHARRPPPRPVGLDVRVGRQRPRRAPQLPRAPRAHPPPARQRRSGDQAERQPALRDVGGHGRAVPACVRRGRASRGRCSCRATTCRAARRSGRSPRPGSASPPSTSACRSCRCTPRASCAASTIRRGWPRRSPPTSSRRPRRVLIASDAPLGFVVQTLQLGRAAGRSAP